MRNRISGDRTQPTGAGQLPASPPPGGPAESASQPVVRAGLPEGAQSALQARRRDPDVNPGDSQSTLQGAQAGPSRPPRGAAPKSLEAKALSNWQALVASNRMLSKPKFGEVVAKFSDGEVTRPNTKIQPNPPGMDDKLRVGTKVLNDLSDHNIALLKSELQIAGPDFHPPPEDNKNRGDRDLRLSKKEWEFLKAVRDSPLTLTHATDQNLVGADGKMSLSSHRHLAAQAMAELKEGNPGTPSEELKGKLPEQLQKNLKDIELLGNDGYVFFGLEAGNESEKPKSRFGKTVYQTPLNEEALGSNAIMVLNDSTDPSALLVKNYGGDEHKVGAYLAEVRHLEHWSSSGLNDAGPAEGAPENMKYPALDAGTCKEFEADSIGDRMFFKADVARDAIAMSILVSARKLGNDEIAEGLLKTEPKDINRAINSAFRPQIMVPDKFSTDEFTQRPIDFYKTGTGS